MLETDGELAGLIPFHRISRHRATPLGGHISDGHAFFTRSDEVELAELLPAIGVDRFDFDHLVGNVNERFVFRYDQCYRMDLTAGAENYRTDIKNKSGIIAQTNRKFRKIERDFGECQFNWSIDSCHLKKLISWKIEDLYSKGYKNPFEPWVVKLMKNLVVQNSPECRGLLSGLRVKDEWAALHYAVVSEKYLVSWMPCVNRKFDKYSPGSILYLELADYASRNGIQFIDLGRGENPTKVRLANNVLSMGIGSVCRSPLYQRALAFQAAYKQKLKQILRVLTRRK
ncbi:MAG: GNAT family N-acetyltransferase [Planctomycetota bacterium]